MHDSRHHTRHAIERKVLLGHIDPELILIPQAREEEAEGSADEERGGKGTTTTARAIGGTRGEDLRDDHQGHIEDEILALAREERLLHHGIPVGLGLALDEDGQGVVALAIERRKEEDERAQGETSHEELDVGSLGQSRIAVLTPRHRAHEVDGDEATAHTQEDGGWQTVELEDVAKEQYEQYLEQNARIVLLKLIEQECVEEIRYLCDTCLITKDALEDGLYEAADKKLSAITAILMEYQRQHFTAHRQVTKLSLDEW